MILGSREICASTLLLIVLTDVSIILNIPVLRQLLGLVLLLLLPGFLLVQILRIPTDPLEKKLFLIGLSVSFAMFVPLVMNFTLPVFGVSDPISLFPLTIAFSSILAGLSVLAYRLGAFDFHVRTDDFKRLMNEIKSPAVLGASLVIVLGIYGAFVVRFDLSSLVSLCAMLSIAAAVIILTIKRSVSERYYPLYVLAIALALQYSHTLASAQLSQNDAMLELYLANLVKAHGFWDPGFTLLNPFLADYAAMLSVAILPNVYSLLLNIDVVWFYQFIVPVIFSVVPLALYQICKTEFKFTNKMAFLSAFFFMSFYTFYDEVPRQWIAELFLVLVIYLIIRTDLRKPKENTLLVLFVASLTVSHYSVSYIFLYYVVLFLIGYPLLSKKNGSAERRYGLYPLLSKKNGSAERRYGLRLLTVALLFIIVAAWYVMASGGGPFYAFLELWAHTVSSLASGMFAVQDPHVAAGLGANVAKLSLLHKIGNYWIIATTPIITLGLAIMVWRRKTEQINPKALLFSLASFVTMAVAVVVPTLGAAMNGNRAYELALIFLAPCYVFGLVAISDKIAKLLRANGDLARRLRYAVLIGVLIPYFFFNYGVIFEIVDTPSNYAFLPSAQQSQRVVAYNYSKDWSYFVQSPTPAQAVSANAWLGSSMRPQTVYVDSSSTAMGEVFGYGQVSPNAVVLLSGADAATPLHASYAYLGPVNVQRGSVLVLVNNSSYEEWPISSFPSLTAGNLVYSNGLATIYYYT